jgi:acyl-CoA synthetase (AMP-forming)/AMP-acid ligase II
MGLPQMVLRRFDADLVADTIARHRVTATFMVPGMLNRLAEAYTARESPEKTLRFLYGGAPFPAPELQACLKVFGPRMIQLYGRFEGGWPITVLGEQEHQRIADDDLRLASSCGRPVTDVELELKPLPSGEGDQLRVRGDCVAPSFRDPDGWCDLGDLAVRDEDGYVFLHGRADGMINTGAFHVYPSEVETAIAAEFPQLHSVVVGARPDPEWGQAVVAELTWPPEVPIPERDEFRGRLSRRLAKYKVPTVLNHHRRA